MHAESEPLVRMSMDSVPDQSDLMPPPRSQSSMNEANSSKRKRKCEKICTNQSQENSTDATSMYGNSQGSMDISNENELPGKRSRKTRKPQSQSK